MQVNVAGDPLKALKLRVLVVDDDARVRRALRGLIERASDLTVVGEAGSARSAGRLDLELDPDVVVLDLLLPRASDGMQVLQELRGRGRPVVAISRMGELGPQAMAARRARLPGKARPRRRRPPRDDPRRLPPRSLATWRLRPTLRRPRWSTPDARGGTVQQRPRADLGGPTNTDAPVPAAQPTWRGSLLSGRSLRYAAGVLLIAGGYWAAAKGAEVLWLTGQAAAFWLATGVGIAVLYLGGWRWWPGVLLGNLLSRVFVLPLWVVLVSTAVEVVMTLAAVLILQRLVGRRAAMDRLDQVGAVLVAVAVNAAVTATGAMLVGLAEGFIETSVMGVFWRSWWLGSLAGGLVVVPLALAWAHTRASAWRGRRVVEAALTLAAVIGLSLLAFSADQPFTYIVFPALIWAGLRLGPPGATLAVAVAAVIAVAGHRAPAGTLRGALAHRQRAQSPALHGLGGADDVLPGGDRQRAPAGRAGAGRVPASRG